MMLTIYQNHLVILIKYLYLVILIKYCYGPHEGKQITNTK
jgi:hypothetical protein